MKTISITLFSLAINLSLFAQSALPEANEAPLRPLFKVELGFQGVGLAYELPVADRWSVDFSTGLGGGYYVRNTSGREIGYLWTINDPVIYLKSEVKYYYNRPKSLQRGKSLRNNAGHYLAFQTKYTTERVFTSNTFDQLEDPLNNALLNEIHWGIQRPMGQRFLFNMHLGLGVAVDYDFRASSIYPGFGLKFSHILFK